MWKRTLLAVTMLANIAFAGAEPVTPTSATNATATATNVRPDYVLAANDIVYVKVYREEDLEAKVRVSKDGTIVMALLGQVHVGGLTREQAARHIRDLLAEKFLVNPQVTVDIVEYSKRRFTVLGQVQRPGTYDMPGNETVNLLQAISMAGGFTRLGAGNRVTVQRGKEVLKVDADSMAKEKGTKILEIISDDTITVGEKIF